MNKKTRIILIVVIGVFILGMALYPQLKKRIFKPEEIAEPAPREVPSKGGRQPLNVNGKVVKHETLTDMFRTKGMLLPDEEVNLSFETSGKITNIYFKEGTFVKQGELLAKMNDKPLLAELQKLEAQIPLLESRVYRQKQLLEKDAVSQEAYESVTTEMDKLHADIDLVKARIEQTELRAPFDGQIGLRLVSEGTYANTSTIISTLTKITPLKVEFSVNEAQANDIRPGLRVAFTSGINTNEYEAKVYAVESRLDEKTLTLKARALYDNKDGKLKPGNSVNIEIMMNEYDDAIVVPGIAVIAEMGKDIAYKYDNGIAKQVTIKKGMRTASSVQILQGLNIGDTLITSGVMQLRDGMPVQLNLTNQ
ncbi:efflux RND transporter periplasmic adaptor subunit [Paludibacter sp. 221]|uniref:efflux RND transporter periplasmic adaptor subunit n=1 Tax=Paludibacter sp. 221 TaxID=2302939 RepID=UPI0013D1E162|nr:efflux RND transporter periplasmic adaptor subunit [Paludibacter sp. 221]NDV46614.1 efflux RND transporter periplasmic adaptor subunit [Paludibacter sp. 221]